MNKNRLSDIIKDAAKVNLSYSASLLNLSKDYIKAMSDAVAKDGTQETDDETTSDSHPTDTGTVKRAPLIVAGRKGEIANASIAVNNNSGISGTVTLVVKGDFAGTKVTPDPETLSLDVNESAIVRIIAKIDNKLVENQDYPGTVVIPELGLQVADFVVRRLSEPAKKTTTRKKPAVKTGKKRTPAKKTSK